METTPQLVKNNNFKEETVNAILGKITKFTETGELVLPTGYSAGNALNAAYLFLSDTENTGKKNLLEVCTKESLANCLFEMVTMGLSVVKKQCYFIPYGNQCKLSVSYIGDVLIAKRDAGIKDVNAQIIYEDDLFQYQMKNGLVEIISHESSLENINNDKIKGAYCVLEMADGRFKTTIMNKLQIAKAWNQGAMKGDSPAHKNFPEEMSKKTVISRALKLEIGSSYDETALNEEQQSTTAANVKNEIKANANKSPIGFETIEIQPNTVQNGSVHAVQQF